MKIALVVCVIFCSFLLASTKPPLPPWLRVYLGLNYIFKEDVDLVHVVVGTDYVGSHTFGLAKKAAMLLTKSVDVLSPIDGGGSQIGFVKVSNVDGTKKEFSLGDYNTLDKNLDAISDVKFQYSVKDAPALGLGLKKARNMFNQDGKNDNKVVVMVTNTAEDSGEDDVFEMAEKLKENGVRICVVVIGENVDDKLIKLMRNVSSDRCFQRYKTYRVYHDTIEMAVKKIIENNQ